MLASCFHKWMLFISVRCFLVFIVALKNERPHPEPSLPLPLTLIHHNFQPATLDKLLVHPNISATCFLLCAFVQAVLNTWNSPSLCFFSPLTVLRISINTVQISPSPKLFWKLSHSSMLSSLTLDIALRSIDPHYSNYHILPQESYVWVDLTPISNISS